MQGVNAATAIQPTRETHVGHQMMEIDAALGMLEGEVERLHPALSGVTRSEPPEAQPNKPQAIESLVPLAEQLRIAVSRITLAGARLRALRDRLEV